MASEISDFANEEILNSLIKGRNSLILTENRIRHISKGSGTIRTNSILISNISSVSIYFKSNVILIILSVLLAIPSTGLMFSSDQDIFYGVAGYVISIFLLILFLVTRRHVISIYTSNNKIVFEISGIKSEVIEKFHDSIEKLQIAKKNSDFSK